MLLNVNKLEMRFEAESLFENLSFALEEGHKVALVGKNGAGKSTILKIIAGLVEPTNGQIEFTKGRTVAYLPQEVRGYEGAGIDYIQENSELRPHQFLPILNGFGIDEAMLKRPMSQLSGGQQTKVLLTKFLLSNADVLLLDEPTNNLDIPSLLWLEAMLMNSKKAMILVSHDLRFLDNVANRVFELKDKKLNVERGKYSDYIERQQKNLERQRKEYRIYRQEVEKLEKSIRTFQQKGEQIDKTEHSDHDKRQAGALRDAASTTQKGANVMKRRLARMKEIEKPFEEEVFTLDFVIKHTEGDIEVELSDVVAGYQSGLQVGPVSMRLELGQTVCLMGENGAGKSTILKTIVGDMKAISGVVKRAEGLVIGNFTQHHERIQGDMTALDFFVKETNTNLERGMHTLSRAGFPEERMFQKLDGLSAGTRARLLLSIFAVLGVNTLVLDEPTNHLDIEAVSALMAVLKEYKGLVLLVSHNRWFLEQLNINSYFNVRDGLCEKIKEFDAYIQGAQERANEMITRLNRLSLIK